MVTVGVRFAECIVVSGVFPEKGILLVCFFRYNKNVMSRQIPNIPDRSDNTHKGTYGKPLFVCGSLGMAGAGVLSVQASLRSGAGVATLCVPDAIYNAVASQLTCPLVVPCPCTNAGRFSEAAVDAVRDHAEQADVLAAGPGLGQQPETKAFLLEILHDVDIPVVLDADGLNLLSNSFQVLHDIENLVITPHPGELARIIDRSIADIQKNRQVIAEQVAQELDATVVLKGHGTVVTRGTEFWTNNTGNPGMATGGSGDVLTGMIASFLGREFDPVESARLAVYLHGLSGDLAIEDIGEESLIARDLISYISDAIIQYRS